MCPKRVEGSAPAEERVEVTVAGNLGVRHVQLRLPVGEYLVAWAPHHSASAPQPWHTVIGPVAVAFLPRGPVSSTDPAASQEPP